MRGGDSTSIKAYNERLVVSALRRDGPLSKAQLARKTGLSANAAMVIANRLIEQDLLMKGQPVRGQVGQPSTPIAVNPRGAFGLGVGIDRRGVQVLLVDLSGKRVAQCEVPHDYPDPVATTATAKMLCMELLDTLDAVERDRTIGLGIAMPGDLNAWTEELGLAPGKLDGWSKADIAGELTNTTGLEVTQLNDASAACAGEMIAGNGITRQSAIYLYFGSFIGAGIVLNGKLYLGNHQNAGSLGSMPIGSASGPHGRNQLIHYASLLQLEPLLQARKIDPQTALQGNGGPAADEAFRQWMETAGPQVVCAIVASLSVIDFEAVVIDGSIPGHWLCLLRDRIEAGTRQMNLSGLVMPEIGIGSIGHGAPSLGAALLPVHARFSPDPELVVRTSERKGART